MKNLTSNKTVQFWLWLGVIIFVWEFSARAGLVNEYILPPFSKVITRTISELFVGKLGLQTISSMNIILIGFLLSFVIAVVMIVLSMLITPLESLFNTLCAIMNPLPSVAIMPLIIMWFGISTAAMVAIIVHGVIWALIRHILDGLHSILPVYKEWGKNIGLSAWQMFTGILIFAIMPELLAGIRVGWGRAWRALISAEMVFGMTGSLGGLGFYINMSRSYANLTNVMAGVVVISIIGIVVESLLFKQIEKHTVQKWGMSHE